MRLFRREKKRDHKQEAFIDGPAVDTGNWRHVFSACLGKMMAIQTACGEIVVKGQDWNVDFSEGTISFGSKKYPIQFIGSESSSSNTWLWGWENINGFSEDVTRLARRTKEMGERWKLEPLTTASFTLDDTFHGHTCLLWPADWSKNTAITEVLMPEERSSLRFQAFRMQYLHR